MPGGMTPHTGQPTPMPNPGGAPMSGGPPLPPQQQQQPGKPPYQQVYIIARGGFLNKIRVAHQNCSFEKSSKIT